MEHDEKCELVDFIAEMSSGMTFSKKDIFTLKDMTRPVMCACLFRSRHDRTELGWGVSQATLDLMRQNFQRTVGNKNLGIPHRVVVSRSALAPPIWEKDGRVIEVDFRNRRRLT